MKEAESSCGALLLAGDGAAEKFNISKHADSAQLTFHKES